jgi:hypothetical protein
MSTPRKAPRDEKDSSRRKKRRASPVRRSGEASAHARRQPAHREKGGLRAFFRKSGNPLVYIGQIVGLIGAVSTVVGLVFVFNPGCRPQDVGTFEFLGDPRVVQPYSFRRYLQRQKLPEGSLSEEFLRRSGVLVEFHFKAKGLRGKHLPLRWELSDAATNDLVSEDEAVAISPSTNEEEANFFVWAPTPKARGMYYVTVTVYQPRKGDIDVPWHAFDSPKFPGLAGPA